MQNEEFFLNKCIEIARLGIGNVSPNPMVGSVIVYKGRIIGEGGKARLNIENLTNALITVYGRTVAIIGEPNQLRLAVDAISSLSSGSMHGPVYTKLESARRREKAEKSQLWEDQNVF